MSAAVAATDGAYCRVCRIQFMRCVPAIVKASTIIRVEIICCSEFNDPVCVNESGDDDLPLQISASFRRHVDTTSYTAYEDTSLLPQSTALVSHTGATSAQIIAPKNAGCYSLYIESGTNNTSYLILPVQSEIFTVYSWEEYVQRCQGKSIPKLLNCYRCIACAGDTLLIKEEYGITLGSHIYDSSIILLRYMETNWNAVCSALHSTTHGAQDACVLELGAGCGLVGIWLSAVLSKKAVTNHCRKVSVFLTDKKQQLPLLQHNININSHILSVSGDINLRCAALDWADEPQINAFCSNNPSQPALIVAGDVFYDREVANLFFDIVRKLAKPGRMKVLVAQKLRMGRDGVPVPLISEAEIRNTRGFDCISKVYSEADVIIWSLHSC